MVQDNLTDDTVAGYPSNQLLGWKGCRVTGYGNL